MEGLQGVGSVETQKDCPQWKPLLVQLVQLVQARRVPGSRVTFLKARVDTGVLPCGAVVFQPSHDWLKTRACTWKNQSCKQILKGMSMYWCKILSRVLDG